VMESRSADSGSAQHSNRRRASIRFTLARRFDLLA
jgi:hypothetical protein